MRTELLRFDGAVGRAPAIDVWMKEHAGELGAIARRWFEVMRKVVVSSARGRITGYSDRICWRTVVAPDKP